MYLSSLRPTAKPNPLSLPTPTATSHHYRPPQPPTIKITKKKKKTHKTHTQPPQTIPTQNQITNSPPTTRKSQIHHLKPNHKPTKLYPNQNPCINPQPTNQNPRRGRRLGDVGQVWVKRGKMAWRRGRWFGGMGQAWEEGLWHGSGM